MYDRCITIQHEGGIKSFGPDEDLMVWLYADDKCTDLYMLGLTLPGVTDLARYTPRGKESIAGREMMYLYVYHMGRDYSMDEVDKMKDWRPPQPIAGAVGVI
jgi:hypothetical protein